MIRFLLDFGEEYCLKNKSTSLEMLTTAYTSIP